MVAGRPSPSPVVRLFSFLVGQARIQQHVWLDGAELPFAPVPVQGGAAATAPAPYDRPGTTPAGVYRYVATGLAPCANDTSQVTVNVKPGVT